MKILEQPREFKPFKTKCPGCKALLKVDALDDLTIDRVSTVCGYGYAIDVYTLCPCCHYHIDVLSSDCPANVRYSLAVERGKLR